MDSSQAVRAYLLGLQARIVDAIEAEDGGGFVTDAWRREPGSPLQGEGRTRLLEGGVLIERGGCSFSHVKGKALPVITAWFATIDTAAGGPVKKFVIPVKIMTDTPYGVALAHARKITIDGTQKTS